MDRKTKNRSFLIWIQEIWEELEVQFFGIIGAIIFFIVIYFIFQPIWMSPLVDFFFEN